MPNDGVMKEPKPSLCLWRVRKPTKLVTHEELSGTHSCSLGCWS
jgi:hypothetical protein